MAHPILFYSPTPQSPIALSLLIQWQGAPQPFYPTPARLYGMPGSARDSSSNKQVPVPCSVPQIFPINQSAGAGKGTYLLMLLTLAELSFMCSPVGVG